jgi:hypothetical protein
MRNYRQTQTEETRQKISISVRSWQETLKNNNPQAWKEYRLKLAEGTRNRFKNKEENRIRYLTITPFEKLGPDARRDKVILDQKNKCGKCQNDVWFNVPLTLELDHISGNRQDNCRENLIALCPNCHSITPTWRGKNKHSCNRITDTEAIDSLKSEPTIRQALIKCGLAPKGGNYKRFTMLKKSIDIS